MKNDNNICSGLQSNRPIYRHTLRHKLRIIEDCSFFISMFFYFILYFYSKIKVHSEIRRLEMYSLSFHFIARFFIFNFRLFVDWTDTSCVSMWQYNNIVIDWVMNCRYSGYWLLLMLLILITNNYVCIRLRPQYPTTLYQKFKPWAILHNTHVSHHV